MTSDTIIALSSPWGVSGLAVVRLSGPDCENVLKTALQRPKFISRRMYYGFILNPQNGEMIDDINYVFFQGPSSYTGEDMLELFPHGNPYIIRKILNILLKYENIRVAEPGEFTRRRLENGKMDFIQAEAVGQLIHAGNDIILQNARRMLTGELSEIIKDLAAKLNDLSIGMELDIDFVEEELEPDYDLWGKRLREIRKILEKLLLSWERSRQLQHDPRIAFFGLPNAGKSSLINTILQQDRLIVSQIPGTTRDYVEVRVNLQNGRAVLIDTAGIFHAESDIDKKAVQKTMDLKRSVDFKVYVVDGTSGTRIKENREFDLVVLTRKDLQTFRAQKGSQGVSNKTGEGVLELLQKLNRRVFGGEMDRTRILLATQRQFEGVKAALQIIRGAEKHLKDERPASEILAFELREAKNRMNEILGQYNPEEILNEIFMNFCIGK